MRPFTLALAAAAALSGAPAAKADTFSPPGVTISFSGTVDISGTGSILCDLHVMLRTTPYDSGGRNLAYAEGFMVSGNPLCSLYQFPHFSRSTNVSYPVAPPSGAPAQRLMIYGVQWSSALTGITCGPKDIELQWNPGPPATLTIPVGTVLNPPVPGCPISGVLTNASGHIVSITN